MKLILDLKWKIIAKKAALEKKAWVSSGEAELGLGVCPCSKDGQLGPGLSHKMSDLWRSSHAPPAQTGSTGAGPPGPHPFEV